MDTMDAIPDSHCRKWDDRKSQSESGVSLAFCLLLCLCLNPVESSWFPLQYEPAGQHWSVCLATRHGGPTLDPWIPDCRLWPAHPYTQRQGQPPIPRGTPGGKRPVRRSHRGSPEFPCPSITATAGNSICWTLLLLLPPPRRQQNPPKTPPRTQPGSRLNAGFFGGVQDTSCGPHRPPRPHMVRFALCRGCCKEKAQSPPKDGFSR